MTLVIVILVSVLVGFGGGWGVKHWKDGAEVALVNLQKADLESRNAQLVASNDRCATDIDGVRKGVAVIVKQVEERDKAASVAMKEAELLAAKHSAQAKAIKQLPPVPAAPEAQCAAMIQEQRDYVQSRHE